MNLVAEKSEQASGLTRADCAYHHEGGCWVEGTDCSKCDVFSERDDATSERDAAISRVYVPAQEADRLRARAEAADARAEAADARSAQLAPLLEGLEAIRDGRFLNGGYKGRFAHAVKLVALMADAVEREQKRAEAAEARVAQLEADVRGLGCAEERADRRRLAAEERARAELLRAITEATDARYRLGLGPFEVPR
jgi:hypothetical protein